MIAEDAHFLAALIRQTINSALPQPFHTQNWGQTELTRDTSI